MEYSQLPKQAQRFIKPAGLPDKVRLPTKYHYIFRGFAILGLLPLSASVLMALTLSGAEQTFYQVVTCLLCPPLLLLVFLKHHLILDNQTQQRFVQLTILGYHGKKSHLAPLQSTELLLRHNSHNRSQFELKLHDIVYPIGDLADTKLLAMFFANLFKLTAKEQISDFPHIHQLTFDSAIGSVSREKIPNTSNKQAQVESKPCAEVTLSQARHSLDNNQNNQSAVPINSAPFIEPLLQPKLVIRIFYPLPFLMVFGFIMKYVGSL
jgi:hypothetical protein